MVSKYDPLKDEGAIKGLTFLKGLIDEGRKHCNWCRWYFDKRVKCWKKLRGGPDSYCNMWELSHKLIEEFRIHGLTGGCVPI